jgi:hypothetical protein
VNDIQERPSGLRSCRRLADNADLRSRAGDGIACQFDSQRTRRLPDSAHAKNFDLDLRCIGSSIDEGGKDGLPHVRFGATEEKECYEEEKRHAAIA